MTLVLLPALFHPSENHASVWLALGIAGLEVTALVAFTAIVGTRVIPRVLDQLVIALGMIVAVKPDGFVSPVRSSQA